MGGAETIYPEYLQKLKQADRRRESQAGGCSVGSRRQGPDEICVALLQVARSR